MKIIKSSTKESNHLWMVLCFGVLGALFIVISVVSYRQIANEREWKSYDCLTSCDNIPLPVFSVPEGIYGQPFELEINAPSGCDIYYTTDGSTPTVRSRKYQKRITVDPNTNLNRDMMYIATSLVWYPPMGRQSHSTVIRARCFRAGVGYGKVKNVVYSAPDIGQHLGFHIVHILIEPDSLFSPTKGIYVLGEKYYSKKAMVEINQQPSSQDWIYYPANYHQRGPKWTRPATLILMDISGKTLFEQNINLCINGMGSRAFAEKSLRIMPDNKSDTVIRHPFFDELPDSTYKRLLLRNSGNDVLYTLFQDALVHRLANGTGVDLQAYTPSVLYINGNYWGIHNIREKQEENYLAAKYDVPLQDISIVNYFEYFANHYTMNYGPESSLQSFEQLLSFIRQNSLADQTAYHAACTQIDVDNFIEYMILQTFFANLDWPGNNVRFYRFGRQTESMQQNGIDAGKWRWLFYDLDNSMNEPTINTFERLRNEYAHNPVTQIFFGFMENAGFKEKFIGRYEYLVKNQLTSEKMSEQINIFEARYRQEIERQIARWREPRGIRYWRQSIEDMKDFAQKRPEIILEQIKYL